MKQYLTLLVFFSFLTSCEIVNPPEDIPAYLHIKPFEVATNPTFEGTANAKITEVWVFVGADFTGAYSLPATVPILETGDRTITLQAGIKDNGISSIPEIYPFYEPAIFEMTLAPNQIDTLQPQTSYISDAVFAFIEDFESADHIFSDDLDGDNETNLASSTEDVFEGDRSGKILLTQDHPQVAIGTDVTELFKDLQESGVFVYLEVNYKSDVDVGWGIAVHPNGSPDRIVATDPSFVAKAEWNKIYFNLSQLIFNNQNAQYQIVLAAQIPTEGGNPTMEQANIYLDNIKLIHF